MSTAPDISAHMVDFWKAYQIEPWARLRQSTSRLNIARHISNKSLRVLDVGGGLGCEAIYFAKQGHMVTLTDSSPSMLEEARNRAEREGISERLTVHLSEADALADLFSDQQFDLIICHMMIEFVSDPQGLVRDMCRLLAPGGHLSLLDTNRYSDVYLQAILLNNLDETAKALGATTYFHRWVNRPTPRFDAQQFIDLIPANGCTLGGHYGILSLCSYLPNEPKYDPQYFAQLEQIEHRMTDVYPYYQLARMFQLIIRKEER